MTTHQILSRLRLGFFTSLIPIFPPIRSPKNQEKIGERQQWRWREENKLFCFSCTSSLKRGGETRPVKAVSVTSSIASSSLTDSITHSSSSFSFSLVDVLGSGNAIRRKKKENKSLYHHQHTNGLNYLLIKI